MSVNRAVIVGRLTRDAELRYTPNGVAVANFTVATNRPFKNQAGEQEADFLQCVIWRKAAENLANYTKKGSLIGVDGRLQTRRYDDKDGKTVFVTEILAESVQFLDTKNNTQKNETTQGSSSNQSTNNYNNNQTNQNTAEQVEEAPIDINDDDLPF